MSLKVGLIWRKGSGIVFFKTCTVPIWLALFEKVAAPRRRVEGNEGEETLAAEKKVGQFKLLAREIVKSRLQVGGGRGP